MIITLNNLQTMLFVESLAKDHKAIACLTSILHAKLTSKNPSIRDSWLAGSEDSEREAKWTNHLQVMGTLIQSFHYIDDSSEYGLDNVRSYVSAVSVQSHFDTTFSILKAEKIIHLTSIPMAKNPGVIEKWMRFGELIGVAFFLV